MPTLYIERLASAFQLTNAAGIRQYPRNSFRTLKQAHKFATSHGHAVVDAT